MHLSMNWNMDHSIWSASPETSVHIDLRIVIRLNVRFYSPVFKLIIQAVRLGMEVQADPYHPFSPTRFRFTSGDATHVFTCSLN